MRVLLAITCCVASAAVGFRAGMAHHKPEPPLYVTRVVPGPPCSSPAPLVVPCAPCSHRDAYLRGLDDGLRTGREDWGRR